MAEMTDAGRLGHSYHRPAQTIPNMSTSTNISPTVKVEVSAEESEALTRSSVCLKCSILADI